MAWFRRAEVEPANWDRPDVAVAEKMVDEANAAGVSDNTCNEVPLKRRTEQQQIDVLRFDLGVAIQSIRRLTRENEILRGDLNLMLEYYGKEVEQVAPQPAFRRLVDRKVGDDSRS